MLKNAVKRLKKIRIFKRIREYKAEINNLLQVTNRLESELEVHRITIKEAMVIYDEAIADLEKVKEKKDKASKRISVQKKTIKELERRRDEFLLRLKSKIPDTIISRTFDKYKYWLAESFIVDKYEPYVMVDDKSVYIDEISAMKGFSKILDKVEEIDEFEIGKGNDGEKEETK